MRRNRNFCTLPLGVVGSSPMRRIWRGTLNDASKAAENVLAASGDLASNASELEVQVDKFLKNVRAM